MVCKFLSRTFFLAWIYSACLLSCAPTPENTPPSEFESYFPITVGSTELQLQIAVHPQEQARGLMHRPQLAPQHGMLFVFAAPQQRSFWMRNTPLPLDLAYINTAGELVELHSLYPYDETSVTSSSHAIQFALELEQGQMKALGIQSGDRLDLDAVARALTARGIDPDTRLVH